MTRNTGSGIFNRNKEPETRPETFLNGSERPKTCAECRDNYPELFECCPKGRRRAIFKMSSVPTYCSIAMKARLSEIASAASSSC